MLGLDPSICQGTHNRKSERIAAVRAGGLGGMHAAVPEVEHRDQPSVDVELAALPYGDLRQVADAALGHCRRHGHRVTLMAESNWVAVTGLAASDQGST